MRRIGVGLLLGLLLAIASVVFPVAAGAAEQSDSPTTPSEVVEVAGQEASAPKNDPGSPAGDQAVALTQEPDARRYRPDRGSTPPAGDGVCAYDTSVNLVAPSAVPDPPPQLRPSGAPDRSSAVYVGVREADGNVTVAGSRPGGQHAEDVAQSLVTDGQMSRPFGWRRDPATGELVWQPINVCTICQSKYPPDLFPPGTGADPGGAWGN